jgi:hypothetical protein
LLPEQTILAARYQSQCPIGPDGLEILEEGEPVPEWEGRWWHVEIDAETLPQMLELLPGEEIRECGAQRRPPGGEYIQGEVAEAAPVSAPHQRGPALTQSQHHHVDAWHGHKISASETMRDLDLEPGLEQQGAQ